MIRGDDGRRQMLLICDKCKVVTGYPVGSMPKYCGQCGAKGMLRHLDQGLSSAGQPTTKPGGQRGGALCK